MKIKCGRHEYELKIGDCMLDNGACYQFCPKDNSELPWGTWHQFSSVKISKKEFKRLIKLSNWEIRQSKQYSFCTYYYWRE